MARELKYTRPFNDIVERPKIELAGRWVDGADPGRKIDPKTVKSLPAPKEEVPLGGRLRNLAQERFQVNSKRKKS